MEYNHFILVTDYNNTGEDVLIFAQNIGRAEVTRALLYKKQSFGECYEIKEEEIQFYCYDPLYLTEKTENNIKNLSSLYRSNKEDNKYIKYK